MKLFKKIKKYRKALILLPVFVYIISYLYLAYYHRKLFIFQTIVHEDGKYTLIQLIFYASHFLGHIPVHTVLAFLFTGIYCCLTEYKNDAYRKKTIWLLFMLLFVFCIFSCLLSFAVFGYEDTVMFIMQKKQGVGVYELGGSWNLHLPSTMLLFLLMPVYIYTVVKIFGNNIQVNASGKKYILEGIAIFLLFLFLIDKNILGSLEYVWTNPRYLAHSVRELMTFPVTYFPIPLYFFMREKKIGNVVQQIPSHKTTSRVLICLFIFFFLGLCYQAYVSLAKGIGNLSQKPAFAKGEELGIAYLLASHYFEHFLDTIYFSILCMLLYSTANNNARLQERA